MLAPNGQPARPPSRALRWATAAALLAAVLAIAGLRSPATADDTKPTPERTATEARASAAVPVLPFEIDDLELRFVPANAEGVFAFRPALAATLPWLKDQGEIVHTASQEMLGYPLPFIKAEMIDHIVSGLRFRAKTRDNPGMFDHDFGLVRLRPGHTWQTILAAALPKETPKRHADKTYYRIPAPIENWPDRTAGLLDARTLVLGSEASVKAALDGSFQARPMPADDWKPVRSAWIVIGCDLRKVRTHILGSKDSLQAELLQPYEPLWRNGDHLLAGLMYGTNFELKAIASKADGPLNADETYRKAMANAAQDIFQAWGLKAEWLAKLKAAAGNDALGIMSSPTPAQLMFRTMPVISYAEFFPKVSPKSSGAQPVHFQSDLLVCDVPRELSKELQEKFQVKLQGSSAGGMKLTADVAKKLREYVEGNNSITILTRPSLQTFDGQKGKVSVDLNQLQMTLLHTLDLPGNKIVTRFDLQSTECSIGGGGDCLLQDDVSALCGFAVHQSGEKYRLLLITIRFIKE